MSSPSLLIFLPVRNGEAHLAQAIQSIINQSDEDWRLLILENSSNDLTPEIIRSFTDPRICVIPSLHPMSIEENWHRIIQEVNNIDQGNPLVTFLGHDDYLYPNFVSRIKALADEAPDATLYQVLFDLVDVDGRLIRPCRPIPQVENWLDLAAAIAWGMRDAYGTGYAFRARSYQQVGGMPRLPGILYADHLLFTRLARLGYKRADIVSACAYRLHSTSMSNALSGPRINTRLCAFSEFFSIMETEFHELFKSDLGRHAMQTLLARELFVFDAPLVRRLLTKDSLAQLGALRSKLYAWNATSDLGHWSYQSSTVGRTLGRLKLQARYLKAVLGAL